MSHRYKYKTALLRSGMQHSMQHFADTQTRQDKTKKPQSRLEAIAIRLEDIANAIRVEAIAIRMEAIALI